jgi:hypothetical protein
MLHKGKTKQFTHSSLHRLGLMHLHSRQLQYYTMVKHIVFFKLSNSLTPENKQAQLKTMGQIFSPLGSKFPLEDLKKYMVSDEHAEAVGIASKIEKTKAVIDYEF